MNNDIASRMGLIFVVCMAERGKRRGWSTDTFLDVCALSFLSINVETCIINLGKQTSNISNPS